MATFIIQYVSRMCLLDGALSLTDKTANNLGFRLSHGIDRLC